MTTLTNREITRSILRRYMADYTNQKSPPKTINSGFFAILICDTGEVWLSETTNFKAAITAFHNHSQTKANCVREAINRGSPMELWFLTQPARFSAQTLENELYEAGLLASRKSPVREGSGDLYVIRHKTTLDYFVVTNRVQGMSEYSILNNFIIRLQNIKVKGKNEQLSAFVTINAQDILAHRNFDITHLDSFVDKEDEWLKRQVYIDNCKSGKNLNYKSVD